MSAHVTRAQLLLAQFRPADAERELLQALAAQPDDSSALALLALSRSEQNKGPEALDAIRTGIGLAPDRAYLHYVHAVTLENLLRHKEARTAINEALRLDPDDEDSFTLLASIELASRDWNAGLAAAEQALALNPEHVNAANLRAMALVNLGRKEEASATVDYALQREPENAFSHANQGWTCLHRNDPRRAQDHFHEALRLEPDLEHARNGMLEALKARNPIYRAMLAYFLWMGRLSTKFQWALVIGAFFGGRLARNTVAAQPHLGWVIWPLLTLFYIFIYLSWTAVPMFNLLLRFDRFGRHVLSRDQRLASTWFGSFFFAALGSLTWWLARGSDAGLLATFFFAVLSICIAATFLRTGRNRLILGGATGAMTLLAATAMGLLTLGLPLGAQLVTGFSFAFIGFQIAANLLTAE